MFQWRNIIGLLSLVIASAGPMPLWLHHATSHSSVCCHDASHCVSLGAHTHAHDQCGSDHDHADVPPTAANQSSGPAESAEVASQAIRSTAHVLGAEHSHDCWVCYQLSQVASLAVVIGQQSSAMVASRAAPHPRQFISVAICTLCAPRGPPAVA